MESEGSTISTVSAYSTGYSSPIQEGAFNPGDVIITDCYPLLVHLKKEFKNSHCRCCLRKRPLKMCSCELVGYCSDLCEELDNKGGHAFECDHPLFLDFCQGGDSDLRLFTFRLFALQQIDKQMASIAFPVAIGPDRSFESMVPHPGDDLMEEDRRLDAFTMVEIIKARDPNINVEVEELVCLMGIISKYTFEMRGAAPEMLEVGWGLYFEPADLQHSCKPTAVCINDGMRLSVRAIAPIPAGHQPTIDYLRKPMTRAYRKEMLRYLYNLQCECESCDPESNDLASYAPRNYLNLASRPVDYLNERIWSMVYAKHHLVVQAFRTVYYEFDERISLQYLVSLRIGLATIMAREAAVTAIKREAEDHLKITFGDDHSYFKYYQTISLPLYETRFGEPTRAPGTDPAAE